MSDETVTRKRHNPRNSNTMSKKALPAILAMGLAALQAQPTASLDQVDYRPRGAGYRKTNLTTKQKKKRAASKAARKARRAGR